MAAQPKGSVCTALQINRVVNMPSAPALTLLPPAVKAALWMGMSSTNQLCTRGFLRAGGWVGRQGGIGAKGNRGS